MKKFINDEINEISLFSRTFLKWFCISLLVGSLGGILGAMFYSGVVWANELRTAHQWLIWLLPIGGLIIALIYKSSRTEGENTNNIIDSILLGEDVEIELLPVILLSTIITHLFGGSAGREGAALQIGGSLGSNVGKLLKLDEKEQRIAVLSGMSAVFSALFGTPVAATVFALEVCSVGIIHYSGLVPCGISALTAYLVTRLFGISPTRFTIGILPTKAMLIVKVLIISVACAVLSILFCELMHFASKKAEQLMPDSYLRIFAGGVFILVLTLLVGNMDYNGGGVDVIVNAVEKGSAKPFAFLLKILFTVITLSCGFKGGEIVPTFFIGATFGCVLGPLIGLPAEFSAAIGLIATFCGAVNCPLASVILSVELFGSSDIIYFAIACFISYMLSGYSSLYSEQKIIYSKLKAEYINRKAK